MVLTSWSLLRTSCIYGYRHTLVHSFWYVTSYEQCLCTYYVSVYIFINKISHVRLLYVQLCDICVQNTYLLGILSEAEQEMFCDRLRWLLASILVHQAFC